MDDIQRMDSLCEEIIKVKAEIADLEDEIEAKKASIESIQDRVFAYFMETKRDSPYRSPFGTLYLQKDLTFLMPKGEKLRELFEHFRKNHGEDYAWGKMSIHVQTLKTELKDHAAALEARGDDPLLDPLPGVEVPKTIQKLRFRRK